MIPLRPWPQRDDARVKALRKQARAGVLAPLVLLWHSGLHTGIVLDGHARLVAAEAEERPARVLYVTGVHVERREPAIDPTVAERLAQALEHLVVGADPRAAKLAMDATNSAAMRAAASTEQPVAMTRARALTGGARRWMEEVRLSLEHSPRIRFADHGVAS